MLTFSLIKSGSRFLVFFQELNFFMVNQKKLISNEAENINLNKDKIIVLEKMIEKF